MGRNYEHEVVFGWKQASLNYKSASLPMAYQTSGRTSLEIADIEVGEFWCILH